MHLKFKKSVVILFLADNQGKVKKNSDETLL